MSISPYPVRHWVERGDQRRGDEGSFLVKYLLTIYREDSRVRDLAPEELKAAMDAYAAFGQEASEKGVYLGGEGLQPTETATTVRVRDGDRLLSDGPFAETKEQLGGYYLLDCKDTDEAIEWAAKIPGAATGCVEVRPVMEYASLGYEDRNPDGELSRR
jgi:hypothetical protein